MRDRERERASKKNNKIIKETVKEKMKEKINQVKIKSRTRGGKSRMPPAQPRVAEWLKCKRASELV